MTAKTCNITAENGRQKKKRGVGEERLEVEKRISPLSESRWDRDSLRSK
jgi:hypothetical protein